MESKSNPNSSTFNITSTFQTHWISSVESDGFHLLRWALDNSSVVGLDAEWKPSRAPKPSSFPLVSLLQIACRVRPQLTPDLPDSCVFLLDLQSIHLPSVWELLRDMFVSPDLLKLGFRFKQDLVYLSSTFRSQGCEPGFEKVEPFLDITSVYHYLRNRGKKLPKETKSLAAICEEVLRVSLSKVQISKSLMNVFKNFIDGRGNYMASVSKDDGGMLSLYEASHHALQGETVLDEYRAFTSSYLKVFKRKPDDQLAKMVKHALELPWHWRMPRIEARWYLNVYETQKDMNPILLELAKLDFNMLQAIHQRDLRDASRWWRDLDLGRRLSFSRDRLVESFFVALGVIPEPQFGYGRVELAKVCQFITTLDDIYDVYGSLDELECFTDAIDRWDVKSMDQLPEYMKICFLALYNTVNEMGFEILKEQGLDAIPYLRKVWADFCKSMLVESKWYHNGYRPSLPEYLDNSWVSSSAPVILVNALFLASREIRTEALDVIDESSNLIRWSSMIFRLCNDLGTCTKEEEIGDVSSAIQCYMNDANVSEGIARDHVKDLIADAWKKLNKEVDSCSPRSSHFTKIAFNIARVAHCIYQFGDGHSVQDEENKDRITSLLIKPIVINDMLS